MVWGSEFGVAGLGVRVWGLRAIPGFWGVLGVGVWGLSSRVWGLGPRVWGLSPRVWGFRLGSGVWGFQGLEFRV